MPVLCYVRFDVMSGLFHESFILIYFLKLWSYFLFPYTIVSHSRSDLLQFSSTILLISEFLFSEFCRHFCLLMAPSDVFVLVKWSPYKYWRYVHSFFSILYFSSISFSFISFSWILSYITRYAMPLCWIRQNFISDFAAILVWWWFSNVFVLLWPSRGHHEFADGTYNISFSYSLLISFRFPTYFSCVIRCGISVLR